MAQLLCRKEIKNLIGVIKQERDQISQEVDSMAKELKKYKSAYKKLVILLILSCLFNRKKKFNQKREQLKK